MMLIYTMYNIFCIGFGKIQYKTWFNPITVYALVWEISVGLHEIGFIQYYELSAYCWFVIISLQSIFVCGCLFGKLIKRNKVITNINAEREKKELKKYIIITMCLAGVAILGNLYTIVSIYGRNLLSSLTDIYADRVNQTREIETIPYIGAFIFVTMPLLGMYLRKHGFTFLIIPAFALAFASALTSGGRAGIVFDMILFGSAYFLSSEKKQGTVNKKETTKTEKRRKLTLYFATAILVTLVTILTARRSVGVVPIHATSLYTRIFGDNVLFYRIIEYLSSPIGVLNEYLKTSEMQFGQNTFLPVFNVLSKFGIVERVNQYQEFFSTPLNSNVGTWLRELVEDFTIVGAVFAVFTFATIASFHFVKARHSGKCKNILVTSVVMLIVVLSFFDWRLRTANIWIAIIFGYWIGRTIETKSMEQGSKDY